MPDHFSRIHGFHFDQSRAPFTMSEGQYETDLRDKINGLVEKIKTDISRDITGGRSLVDGSTKISIERAGSTAKYAASVILGNRKILLSDSNSDLREDCTDLLNAIEAGGRGISSSRRASLGSSRAQSVDLSDHIPTSPYDFIAQPARSMASDEAPTLAKAKEFRTLAGKLHTPHEALDPIDARELHKYQKAVFPQVQEKDIDLTRTALDLDAVEHILLCADPDDLHPQTAQIYYQSLSPHAQKLVCKALGIPATENIHTTFFNSKKKNKTNILAALSAVKEELRKDGMQRQYTINIHKEANASFLQRTQAERYSMAINQLNARIIYLQNVVAQHEQYAAGVEPTIQGLRNQLVGLEGQLAGAHAAQADLAAEYEAEIGGIREEFETTLQDTRDENVKLSEQIEAQMEANEELSDRLEQLTAENTTLTKQLQEARDLGAEGEVKIRELTAAQSALQAELADVRAELREKSEEIDRLKASHGSSTEGNKALQSRIDQLERELQSATTSLGTKDARITTLQAQLAAAQAASVALTTRLEAAETANTALLAQANELTQENERLQRDVTALHGTIFVQRIRNMGIRNQLTKTQTALDEATGSLTNAKTELRSSEDAREELLTTQASLKRDLATREASLKEAEEEISILTEQNRGLIRRQTENRATITSLQKQLSEKTAEATALETRATTAEAALTHLRETHASLTTGSHLLQGKVARLTQEIAEREARLSNTQTSSEAQAAELVAHKRDLEETRGQLTHVRAERDGALARITDLERDLQALSQEKTTLITTNADLQAQIQQLTDTVAARDATIRGLETQRDAAGTEVEAAQAETARHKQALDHANTLLERFNQDDQAQHAKIRELQARLTDETYRANTLVANLGTLEAALAAATDANTNSAEVTAHLQANLAAGQAALATVQANAVQLTGELAAIKAEATQAKKEATQLKSLFQRLLKGFRDKHKEATKYKIRYQAAVKKITHLQEARDTAISQREAAERRIQEGIRNGITPAAIKALTRGRDQLIRQLESVSAELAKEQAKTPALLAEMAKVRAGYEKEAEKFRSEIAELKTSQAAAAATLIAQNQQLQTQQGQIADLTTRLGDATERNQRAQEGETAQTARIAALQAELQAAQRDKTAAKEETGALRALLQQEQAAKTAIHQQAGAANTELSTLRNAHQVATEAFQRELDAKTRDLEARNAALAEAETKIAEQAAIIRGDQEQLTHLVGENDLFRVQRDDARLAVATAGERITALTAELDTARIRLEGQERDLASAQLALERNVESATQSEASLKKTIDELRGLLKTSEERITVLDGRLEAQGTVNAEAQGQLQQGEADLTALREKLFEADKKLETFQNDKKALEAAVISIREEMAQAGAGATHLEQEIRRRLDAQIAENSRILGLLNDVTAVSDARYAELNQLRNQLSLAQHDNAELLERKAALETELQLQGASLTTSRGETAATEKKLKEVEGALKKSTAAFKLAIQELQTKLVKADADIAKKIEELGAGRSANTQVQAALDGARGELESLRAQLSEAKTTISGLRADNIRLSAEANGLNNALQKANAAKWAANQACNVVTAQNTRLAAARDQALETIQKIQAELEASKAESATLAQDKNGLQAQVAALEANLEAIGRNFQELRARNSDTLWGNDELNRQVADLNSKLVAAAQTLIDHDTQAERDLQALRDELAGANRAASELGASLTATRALLQDKESVLARTLQESADAMDQLHAELGQKVAALDHAHTDHDALQIENASLKRKVDDLTVQVNTLERTVADQASTIATKTAQLEQEKVRAEKESAVLGARLADQEKKLAAAEKAAAENIAKLTETFKKQEAAFIAGAAKEAVKTADSLKALNEKMQGLRASANSFSARLKKEEAEVKAKEEALKALVEDKKALISSHKDALELVSDALRDTKEERNEIAKKAAGLESQLAAAYAEGAATAAQASEKAKELLVTIDQLKTQLREEDTKVAAKERDLEALVEQQEGLNSSYQDELRKASEELRDMKKERDKALKKAGKLEKELASSQGAKATLAAQLTAVEEKIADIVSQIAPIMPHADIPFDGDLSRFVSHILPKVTEEHKKNKERLTALSGELKEALQTQENLRKENIELSESLQQLSQGSGEEKARLNSKIAGLEQRCQKAKSALETAKQDVTKIEDERDLLISQICNRLRLPSEQQSPEAMLAAIEATQKKMGELTAEEEAFRLEIGTVKENLTQIEGKLSHALKDRDEAIAARIIAENAKTYAKEEAQKSVQGLLARQSSKIETLEAKLEGVQSELRLSQDKLVAGLMPTGGRVSQEHIAAQAQILGDQLELLKKSGRIVFSNEILHTPTFTTNLAAAFLELQTVFPKDIPQIEKSRESTGTKIVPTREIFKLLIDGGAQMEKQNLAALTKITGSEKKASELLEKALRKREEAVSEVEGAVYRNLDLGKNRNMEAIQRQAYIYCLKLIADPENPLLKHLLAVLPDLKTQAAKEGVSIEQYLKDLTSKVEFPRLTHELTQNFINLFVRHHHFAADLITLRVILNTLSQETNEDIELLKNIINHLVPILKGACQKTLEDYYLPPSPEGSIASGSSSKRRP